MNVEICVIHEHTEIVVSSIGLAVEFTVNSKTNERILYLITMVGNSIIVHQLPQADDIELLKNAVPRKHICWTCAAAAAVNSTDIYSYMADVCPAIYGYLGTLLGPWAEKNMNEQQFMTARDGIALIAFCSYIELMHHPMFIKALGRVVGVAVSDPENMSSNGSFNLDTIPIHISLLDGSTIDEVKRNRVIPKHDAGEYFRVSRVHEITTHHSICGYAIDEGTDILCVWKHI